MLTKREKKRLEYVLYVCMGLILVSAHLLAFGGYFLKGDIELVHIATQQRTYASSFMVVLIIVDIILFLGLFFYVRKKVKKSK